MKNLNEFPHPNIEIDNELYDTEGSWLRGTSVKEFGEMVKENERRDNGKKLKANRL